MEPTFIQVHTEVSRFIEELHEKQEVLHKQYKEYLEKNKSSKVFGLDSFYYQTRLLDLESKHFNEQYTFINNRIYCDYYKLYGMVKVFYKDCFKQEPRKKNYPIYKDLETFKTYDIQETISLNIDIAEMIKKAYIFVHKSEEDLQLHKPNSYVNIDNYFYNHHYNNSILKKKIELYEKYLQSYHIYHMSFLSHLRDRIMLLFRQSTNRVIMSKPESWVEERLVPEYPIEPVEKYIETPPIEIVIHPQVEVPVDVTVVPVEVPVEVPVVLVEVPVVPVEVSVVPPEVPVEVPVVPVFPAEVPVEVPQEVPVEVQAEVPVEVPVVPVVPAEVPVVPAVSVVPAEVSVVPAEVPVEVPAVSVVPVDVTVVPVVPLEVPAEVPAEVHVVSESVSVPDVTEKLISKKKPKKSKK